MKVLRADSRFHHWEAPHGYGCFRPSGQKHYLGNPDAFEQNPRRWESEGDTYAARIFVGFNVGGEPRWDLDDLVALVRREREAQGHPPDASFVAQKGIYQSRRTGDVIEEDGAQVILIDMQGLSQKHFQSDMEKLAEAIAAELEQEEVVLEIQKNGISVGTYGIVA